MITHAQQQALRQVYGRILIVLMCVTSYVASASPGVDMGSNTGLPGGLPWYAVCNTIMRCNLHSMSTGGQVT